MSKLTKADLVAAIAEEANASQKTVEEVLKAQADICSDSLREGVSLTLPGLGVLKPTRREARMGRNPQTGESLEIAAQNGVGFKAAKSLKDALN